MTGEEPLDNLGENISTLRSDKYPIVTQMVLDKVDSYLISRVSNMSRMLALQ
jgi:hypothetical protein